ncbi:DUF1620-domain-containing protein [Ramaria rubella]|nr:DUF1620-domain-containing protein [Ramaria rubella]
MRAFLWLLLATAPCFALHESDVGKIDWHKELVGLPRIESQSVAPRFQLVAGRKQRSLIIVVSKSNVLAAVNVTDGNIVWRHVLDSFDLVGAYRSNPGFVATLSGPGGAHLRSYDAINGHLVFDSRLHKPDTGRLLEPVSIGQDLAFSVDRTSDLFALTNANTVRRVNGLTGETNWEWTSEDRSSSVLYCKIVTAELTTYIVGFTKSFNAYTLRVVALNSSTGLVLSSADIPSNVNGPFDFVALTSSRTPQPMIAWLEDGYIRTASLNTELKIKPKILRDDIYKELKDVGIADAGIVVALKRDGTSHVLRVVQETNVKKVWEFANSAASSDQSEATHAGGIDKTGQPYVARSYWSYLMRSSSLQIFAANGAEGKGMVTGFTFPFDPITHGSIQHFALEVANPQPYVFVARTMFTTSTGALQLWQQDEVQWTREESLAEIKNVEFVDLPEKKVAHDALGNQNFLARLIRQAGNAKSFPAYAAAFGRRFLTGSYTTGKITGKEVDGSLWRDAFGFRKLLVASTSTGKVFGIDTARGNILWSRLLVEGSDGGTVEPFKMFVTATVSDGKQPEIVLLAHRQSPSDDTSTVAYTFEALTGLNIRGGVRRRDILTGTELLRGTVADAYLLRQGNKTIVVVDENHKIHLYPNDALTRASFTPLVPTWHLVLEDTQHHLSGYQIHVPADETAFTAFATWTASVHPSEHIQAVITRPHEPVAAIGKVLGDRRTLYKYLNPHLVAILTASRATPPRCSVYLIDGAKGTILYHASVPASDGVCRTQAAFTENWLVYHYYEAESSSLGTKGYRIVSVELYEGTGIDSKTRSSDLTSYSYDSSLLTVFQQSFIYPHDITALATTSTKFGISTKDLVVANVKHQIQSFPRRLFDPRRPKGKPTAEEQEEWLLQYDPVIPDDPRRVISHNYNVAGIRKIVTSPASLESTSIVLAYGLDLFLTRVAPSNTFDILSESFNKLQLVLTIAALGMGIAITKPMVQRKQMKQRWYYL